MGLGLGLRLVPGLVRWPWATEAKMRRSGRSQKKDTLMIQVMYLHTPASPLDSGALLCSSPPSAGAVAAESQLEVLVSQLVPVCVCLPDFPPPDPIRVGRLGSGREGQMRGGEGREEEGAEERGRARKWNVISGKSPGSQMPLFPCLCLREFWKVSNCA